MNISIDSTSPMEVEADSTSAMETETETETEASSSGEALISRDKRWNFLDEIVKTVDSSVNISFPDLEELMEEFGSQVYITQEGREEGRDYNCRSVLKIWPEFRKSIELQHKYPDTLSPKHIGEVIMNDLQSNTKALEMIDKLSVDDLGFVALSLSQEWLAKSIHTMLKNGIDTWAPILPVAKVVVEFPSLEEKIPVGSLRQHAIAETLTRMLRYSGVHVAELSRPPHSHESSPKWDSALMVKPSEQISIIQRKACDTDWVIYVERKPPFIIAKTDFNLSSLDMQTLRYGINEVKADWIVYVTPVRQQEYIEMCFTAAKLEGWIKTNMEGKWSPSREKEYPVLTYAGYRTCSTQPEELDNLLGQVKASCDDVAKHRAAQSLGYTAEAVFTCVLVYTYLKNNRLTDFTFSSDEMVNEEGNTCVYLLHRRADVRDITRGDAFRKGIDELKKASDLTLEKYEGYGKSEERMLGLHLLNFTEVLKESSMFVLPHLMCEYLYDLAKKFKSYSDFTSGSVAETRLLLCEATAVVMEKCFDLLGITDDARNTAQSLLLKLPTDLYDHIMNSYVLPKHTYVEPAKKKQKMAEREQSTETTLEPEFVERFITPCFVSDDRLWDPVRKSRFEVFTISPRVAIPSFDKGKLFGFISVSDKYGFRSDSGDHLLEPDFAYVSLFHHEWYDPINMNNNSFVCLENYPSVPFSSSIEVQMELYVTTEEKDECFQLCDGKCEIDLEEIWGKESNSKCGYVGAEGEDGETFMFYILLKDAADASLEVTFNMDKDRVVHGNVYAYYGGDFSYDCPPTNKVYYRASLFCSSISETCTLPLKRSMMAVPMNGSLIIAADFTDGVTEMFILFHRHSFSIKDGNREVVLKGTGCSLTLKIVLK